MLIGDFIWRVLSVMGAITLIGLFICQDASQWYMWYAGALFGIALRLYYTWTDEA